MAHMMLLAAVAALSLGSLAAVAAIALAPRAEQVPVKVRAAGRPGRTVPRD